MYQTILFDLDGTLTDPGLGITNAVMHAPAKMGAAIPDRRELYRFIGPPLKDSFMQFCGLSEADAERAITFYRDYFAATGKLENQVYPGIPEMLKALKAAGKTLAVATSKPEVFTREILEHFALAGYFDLIAGATMDELTTCKPSSWSTGIRPEIGLDLTNAY